MLLFFSLFLFVIFYRMIAQITIVPFIDHLKTELHNHYKIKESHLTQIRYDLINFFWSIGKSLYYVVWYFFIFFITLPFGSFQILILFLFNSYILGISIYDTYLEKKFPNPKVRSRELKNKRKEILLTGIASTLLLFVPIFGVILSFLCGYISAFLNDYNIKRF